MSPKPTRVRHENFLEPFPPGANADKRFRLPASTRSAGIPPPARRSCQKHRIGPHPHTRKNCGSNGRFFAPNFARLEIGASGRLCPCASTLSTGPPPACIPCTKRRTDLLLYFRTLARSTPVPAAGPWATRCTPTWGSASSGTSSSPTTRTWWTLPPPADRVRGAVPILLFIPPASPRDDVRGTGCG